MCAHTNAGIRVVDHASAALCVFMKTRDPEWERVREWRGGITKGMLVCMCTSSQPHWPDELCSLQKRDFSEMRGHKTGD